MNFLSLFLGILLLNLFAYITISIRPKIFKVKVYRPMLKNFVLSVLPLLILAANILIFLALSILRVYAEIEFLLAPAYVIYFAGLLVWLLFLPNAGYLITELNLNHRSTDEKEVPIWYDIVSVLSFALSGIVNTLANIVIIQLSFLVVFDPQALTASNYAALFFSGVGIIFLIVVGIYLGRVIRFNTWDLLRPLSFLKKIKSHYSERGRFKEFLFYVIINTIFFVIMYVSFGIPFFFIF
ncbi:MAG: DUF1361 domain-containing protein [Defluviitaleaceae bacterium]|nr:DUF1361 domain-containing protein [Defluviitaleaceae bacterium]